jgi:catechol 2,3-dioxygenase-like lactoylglutathione lyase family enzyme
MRTHLAHIQFNVRADNLPFYRDLMGTLGWETLYDGDGMLGVAGANGESFWFAGEVKETSTDYDGPGVNHLAIGATSPSDVDAVAGYLRDRGVPLLFDTPRHRPEFSGSEAQTYYQIMFETPDRILLEIVYTGPKSV